jgi:hypothetical protein
MRDEMTEQGSETPELLHILMLKLVFPLNSSSPSEDLIS